jgi:hypothetical protein
MARRLEIEITESAEYLEKTLKHAMSSKPQRKAANALVVQNRTSAIARVN